MMTIFKFLLLLSLAAFPTNAWGELVDLKCDHRTEPLAVDHDQPLLSWRWEASDDQPSTRKETSGPGESTQRGLTQSAYQIQASTSIDNFDRPDLWDSGWVTNTRSHAIPYQGTPPESKQRVFWRVRIKKAGGQVSTWSQPSWFDAGLLNDRDWENARWIACLTKQQPEYGPTGVMGDWITAATIPPEQSLSRPKSDKKQRHQANNSSLKTGPLETGKSKPSSSKQQKTVTTTYSLDFTVAQKHVVYAGTWWGHVDHGQIELKLNGLKGLNGTEGPPTVYYKDFGFELKTQNTITLTVLDSEVSTPVCFGMQIVFADGTQQIVQTGGHWNAWVGDRSLAVSVVCGHGQPPLGKATISDRAPLPATWYKKDFTVDKRVSAARLYVCGLGYHEPHLNGAKVGDHVLDPGQTDYSQFAHYQTFDITDSIKMGDNALAILLGDGWYNNNRMFSHTRFRYGNPGVRALVDLRYADGSHQYVVSDDSWHWKSSGLKESSVFRGDYLDYRLWDNQWKNPGTTRLWKPVAEVKPLSPQLIAQDFPPIRVVREIDPVRTWQIGKKTWAIDLGQNVSGWVGLKFDEPAGTVIRLRCVEMLDQGQKYLENIPGSYWSCHSTPQHHHIIADGRPHKWRPRFSYHGFRYAEISGLSKPPTAGQIKGLVVHTDAPVIATFKSSDPLLDRIFKMGIQTHLNNMHSILEDCPHREKCLWGGDLHCSWATGMYAIDSGTFYRQQARLFYTPPIDPLGIPGRVGVGKRSTRKTLDFTWSVSPLFTTWRHYQLSGDLRSARDHYDAMKQFLIYFENESPDLLPTIHRYGDHSPPIGVPRAAANPKLIASLNFFAAANRFADLATALDQQDDATWSRDLAQRIGASIVKAYYDADKKTFGNGTHDSLALEFGIVEPRDRQAVAASLAKIYQDNGKRFDGGFMSYNIYPQLTRFGYVDLALAMLKNPDYPGIAQSIRDHDATTIFEKFRVDSRQSQVRHSLDHHAMNHPTAWLLNDIAGIRSHPDHPGMQHLLLAPSIPEALNHANGTLKTPYGIVSSGWKKDGTWIVWQIKIPANSSAEIILPANVKELTIDGQSPVNNSDQSASVFKLSSGDYRIRWQAEQ
jgi:alpha-L-rhamnosidase